MTLRVSNFVEPNSDSELKDSVSDALLAGAVSLRARSHRQAPVQQKGRYCGQRWWQICAFLPPFRATSADRGGRLPKVRRSKGEIG